MKDNQEGKNVNGKQTQMKKKNKMIISIVAGIMVLFMGANIYASTQGYGNIFFMIKHISENKTVTDKNEILSDRDIVISYSSIDMGCGIKIQINNLQIKENEANLFVKIDRQEFTDDMETFKMRVTDQNGVELANQEIKNKEKPVYDETIKLSNFKEDTKVLNVNMSLNGKDLSKLRINLDTREIEIDQEQSFEKVSEVELKKYLSAFALLTHDEEKYNNSNEKRKEKISNENKLLVAMRLCEILNINATINENSMFEVKEMNDILKSFTDIKENKDGMVDLVGDYYFKKETKNNKKYYKCTQFSYPTALCLSVDDISYDSGIYNVTFTYCYPTDDDYASNKIENLPQFRALIQLKYNPESKYSKYYIENFDELNKNETQISNKVEPTANTSSANITEENRTSKNSMANQTTNSSVTTTVKVNNTTSTNTQDTSKIDNYASTMSWKTYRSAGLKVPYPTDFVITETTDYNKGNNAGGWYATIEGDALGKEDGEIINTHMKINLYEPESYPVSYFEELENDKPAGTMTSNITGMTWYRIDGAAEQTENGEIKETYIARVGLENSTGTDAALKIEFCYSPKTTYKAINMINYIICRLQTASY